MLYEPCLLDDEFYGVLLNRLRLYCLVADLSEYGKETAYAWYYDNDFD